jgi:hypothetical protein
LGEKWTISEVDPHKWFPLAMKNTMSVEAVKELPA